MLPIPPTSGHLPKVFYHTEDAKLKYSFSTQPVKCTIIMYDNKNIEILT